jgi:hypothetical protein
MYSLSTLGAGLLAFASFSSALVARDSSTNSPSNRQAWSDGFSISTDFDTTFPDTGKVVTVSPEHDRLRVVQLLTYVAVRPRGHQRDIILRRYTA